MFRFRSDGRPQGVGDIVVMNRDKVFVGPVGCVFIRPKCVNYILYGSYSTGVVVKAAATNSLVVDTDKDISYHENLHSAPILCMTSSEDGSLLITGGCDMSIRVWSLRSYIDTKKVEHVSTLIGHADSVLCVDYCMEYSIIVSGSKDRTCLVWDSRHGKLIRSFGTFEQSGNNKRMKTVGIGIVYD